VWGEVNGLGWLSGTWCASFLALVRLWLFFVSLPPVGLFLLHWLSRPAIAFPSVSECFCMLVHVLVHVLLVIQCAMRCSDAIVCVDAVTVVACVN
jgi:hypothetical protein